MVQSAMDQLRASKYGVPKPEVIDELEGIDKTKLACDEYKMNKLDADR